DFYKALGVATNASGDAVKAAYRTRVKECHPDAMYRKGDTSDAALDEFYLLEEAYSVLSDPGKRSTYDQGRAMKRMVAWLDKGDWGSAMAAVGKVGRAVAVDIAVPLAKG
ncbi:DnaJ domain-containing protein, partial [Tribonema minus]